jgi:hypothetical protein
MHNKFEVAIKLNIKFLGNAEDSDKQEYISCSGETKGLRTPLPLSTSMVVAGGWGEQQPRPPSSHRMVSLQQYDGLPPAIGWFPDFPLAISAP